MNQDRVMGIGATRIVIGLSAIVKVAPISQQINGFFKILSGGGTLEVVPFPLALSGTSTVGWGLGYPVGSNEVFSVGGPAQFYLAATGATMIAAYAPAYTAGVTFAV